MGGLVQERDYTSLIISECFPTQDIALRRKKNKAIVLTAPGSRIRYVVKLLVIYRYRAKIEAIT